MVTIQYDQSQEENRFVWGLASSISAGVAIHAKAGDRTRIDPKMEAFINDHIQVTGSHYQIFVMGQYLPFNEINSLSYVTRI